MSSAIGRSRRLPALVLATVGQALLALLEPGIALAPACASFLAAGVILARR